MEALFKFIYIDNQASQTLILLHGTGADEHDLLSLVAGLNNSYNILSLRGNVSENGMTRFFARSAPGVFDEDSIHTEAEKLSQFIKSWRKEHPHSCSKIAYLGYSNGANMILALTLLHPKLVEQAVLLHPMVPLEVSPALNLTHKQFLVTTGKVDLMIPASEGMRVVTTLQHHGAKVEHLEHEGGHEIRPQEIQALTKFLT